MVADLNAFYKAHPALWSQASPEKLTTTAKVSPLVPMRRKLSVLWSASSLVSHWKPED